MKSLAQAHSVEPYVCFFQIRFRGPRAVRASDAGSTEELTVGDSSPSALQQLVPQDETLAGRCQGKQSWAYAGPGPRGRTLSWGGHEVSLPVMLPWVPRPLLPWRVSAQTSIVFPGGRLWL